MSEEEFAEFIPKTKAQRIAYNRIKDAEDSLNDTKEITDRVESVFESLPLLVAEPRVEQHLYNGCPTSRYPAADGRYRVRSAAGQFLGLANITGGVLRVEKLFVERN